MIAIFLAPVYLLVNYYIVCRSLKWLRYCHGVFGKRWFKISFLVVYILLSTSLITAFFLPASGFQRIVKAISNQFLGTFMYILIFTAIGDLIKIILRRLGKVPSRAAEPERYRRSFAVAGGVIFFLVIAMSIYGVANSRNIKVKEYNVLVNKECADMESMNVVLVADLHLGYNVGSRMMEKMVTKINAQEPDLVVIAGDIYDNQYEALDDPERLAGILSGIESTYGVYACYGNHDVEEPILAGFTFGGKGQKLNDERLEQFLADSNIELLTDETILVDDAFYVAGRRDYERPGNISESRLAAGELLGDLDKTKPIIVIDHEPRELQELADAGADLDLCGHTHDGQVFPGNLTIGLFWENACGYMQKDRMHNIVTSGVGVFGPNMRTFTDSEICSIKVTFTK